MNRSVFVFVCVGLIVNGIAYCQLLRGEVSGPDAPIPLELAMEERSGQALLAFPEYEIRDKPAKFERNGSLIRVSWSADGSKGSLSGTLDADGSLSGSFSWDAFSAPFILHPATLDAPYSRQEIRFSSGEISLAGELWLPNTPGPHPAVVLVRGSGDNERWWVSDDADLFARNGVAVLVYDKRGNGGSGGSWKQGGFDELAADAIAAVEFMRARPEIESARIGLSGVSQAGWIMPLAASRSDAVRFLIIKVGAAVSVEEEGYYDFMVRLQDAGYGEEEQRRARALLELDNRVTRTGEGWEEFLAALKAARREPWFKAMEFTPSPGVGEWRSAYRRILDFDPRPVLEGLRIPVLWLYGTEDKSVHTPTSVTILEEIQAKHPVSFSIEVFANAGHSLRVAASRNTAFPIPPPAPGVDASILKWMAARGIAPANAVPARAD